MPRRECGLPMPIEVTPGTIAKLRISRPEMRNALDSAHLADLEAAITHLSSDDGVRVVLIEGEGGHFSSGADLAEVLELSDLEAARSYFGSVGAVMAALLASPKPTVASVRGYCLAGAMGLAAAADIVIAAETATFGLPEIGVGLFPMVVSSLLLPEVGPRRLLDLSLTGRMMPAVEAREVGLASRVVPDDDLERVTMEVAEALARRSPDALAAGKRALWQLAAPEFFDDVRFLREEIARLATGERARTEMQAFFERRRKGRGTGR